MSKKWIERYLKEMKVGDEEVKRRSCYRSFRLGDTIYLSKEEITFQIVMKTDNNDYVRRELIACEIDAVRVNFFLGRETSGTSPKRLSGSPLSLSKSHEGPCHHRDPFINFSTFTYLVM